MGTPIYKNVWIKCKLKSGGNDNSRNFIYSKIWFEQGRICDFILQVYQHNDSLMLLDIHIEWCNRKEKDNLVHKSQ